MPGRSVITIGNFDGVHRGHRAIVARARRIADEHGDCRVIAMAFDPHPATVLRPQRAPLRLMSRQRKVQTLRSLGVDEVVILEPTPTFLNQEPEAFITSLVAEHRPTAFVEGPDFRFGKGRRGDDALLRAMGTANHFDMVIVPAVEVALSDLLIIPVSSSNIRWLLSCGRVADAARCLGQAYVLESTVVAGEKRGRAIGVPTINLDMDALRDQVIPADGVYAGLTTLDDGTTRPSAISIGDKPTFGRRMRTVEAHLLDFDADLYDRAVRVSFSRWLRDQQPFPHPAALKDQLQRDIEQTRCLERLGWLADATGVGPAAAHVLH